MQKDIIILSTPTCIKCKTLVPAIRGYCESNNIQYVQYNAMTDPGRDWVQEFDISSVPTVLIREEGFVKKILTGDFDITEFTDSLATGV